MSEELGGSLTLYRAAFPLERAMADVEWERWSKYPAHLVEEVWDAWKISYENLPYLAWGMGVTLWEEAWDELTQREWTHRQWEYKSLRGSVAGIRMALEINGYDLVEYRTAPQGFFISPNLTKAEWDAWIEQMPELRIKFAHGKGRAEPWEFFITPPIEAGGDAMGFITPPEVDEGFISEGDGWILYGRRAVVRYPDGREESMLVERRTVKTTDYQSVDVELIHTPGVSRTGMFIGEDFFFPGHPPGDVAPEAMTFIGAEEVAPAAYTFRLDRQYIHQESTLQLDMLEPGYEVRDPRYEQNSDIGDAGPFLFIGDGFVGASVDSEADVFIGEDLGGAEMLADRLFLVDPRVTIPMTAGISFIGVDVFGMPPFTIELMVDTKQTEKAPASFAGETYWGEMFAVPEDHEHIDRALRAIVDAKGSNDRALVTFEVVRPLEFRDTITETTTAGTFVRATL